MTCGKNMREQLCDTLSSAKERLLGMELIQREFQIMIIVNGSTKPKDEQATQ